MDKIMIITHTDLDGYGSGAILFNALMGNFARDYTEGQIFASEEDFGFYKELKVSIPKSIYNYADVPTDIIHMSYNYQTDTRYADLLKRAVHEKRKIYILDISITEESARDIFGCLFTEGIDLTWIDHHQSSVDFINSELGHQLRYNGIVDTKSSAALLTYEYFHNKGIIRDDFVSENDDQHENSIEILAEDIDDHDRWIHEKNGEALNEYFYNGNHSVNMHSICTVIWFYLSTSYYNYDSAISNGKLLVRHTQSMNDRIYKSTKQDFLVRFFVLDEKSKTEDGLTGTEYSVSYIATMLMATCNGVGNSSLFGEDDTNHDTKDLLLRYSSCWNSGIHALRSTFYSCDKSHVNCNIVAEMFGGGGHKHAAGCTINDITDINRLNINAGAYYTNRIVKENWITNSGLTNILNNVDGCESANDAWDKLVGNIPIIKWYITAHTANDMFGGKNFVSVTDNPLCGINEAVGCDKYTIFVSDDYMDWEARMVGLSQIISNFHDSQIVHDTIQGESGF